MPSASAKSLDSIINKLEKLNIKPKFMAPLDRLVYAVLSENRSPAAVEKAMASVLKVFFDWNEARVARWVEIARALDPLDDADQAAIRLRNTLNRLFDLRGELSLDFFEDMKVTEARKVIFEVDPDFKRDEVGLMLYQCLPGMTPPITPEIVAEAKKLGVITKNGTKAQLQKLLTSVEDHTEAVKVLHYIEMSMAQQLVEKTSSKKSTRSSTAVKKSTTTKTTKK